MRKQRFDFKPRIFWIHSQTIKNDNNKKYIACCPIVGKGGGNSKIYYLADLSQAKTNFGETVYFGEKYSSYSMTKVIDHTFSWYVSGNLEASSQFNSVVNYYYLCTE